MSASAPAAVRSPRDLLSLQLALLYDLECRLADTMPVLRDAATDPSLRRLLWGYQESARGHRERVEYAFALLGGTSTRIANRAAIGLEQEAEAMAELDGDDVARDAVVIATVRLVAHHKIASYGTASIWARHAGAGTIADLLTDIREEERVNDQQLVLAADVATAALVARC